MEFEGETIQHFVVGLIGKDPAFGRARAMDENIAAAEPVEACRRGPVAAVNGPQVGGMEANLPCSG